MIGKCEKMIAKNAKANLSGYVRGGAQCKSAGRLPDDRTEGVNKMGVITKSAVLRYLGKIDAGEQHLLGVVDAGQLNVLLDGYVGAGLEIAGQLGTADEKLAGNILGQQRLSEMMTDIVHYVADIGMLVPNVTDLSFCDAIGEMIEQ